MEESKGPVAEIIGDGGWGETRQDVRDMQRLGKKQVFKVCTGRKVESGMPPTRTFIDALFI